MLLGLVYGVFATHLIPRGVTTRSYSVTPYILLGFIQNSGRQNKQETDDLSRPSSKL